MRRSITLEHVDGDTRAFAPTVYVVDDDVSVRESLELLIRHEGWRVQSFGTAHEFLAHPRAPGPGCMVLDVHLPDVNGLELQSQLAAHGTAMPILIISGQADVPMTVRAMKKGAVEVLTKPFRHDALRVALLEAIGRSEAALASQAAMRDLQQNFSKLSRREREVMALVVTGRLNKQIASELAISEITVKAHRGQAMRKMTARSVADLVTMAARLQSARATQGDDAWREN